MGMKQVKISSMNSENFNSENQYSGVYLHGDIEIDKGFDIFSFDKKQDFNEGIHQLEIDGKKCFLFLWKPEDKSLKLYYDWRGYLLYQNDSEVGECLSVYLNKNINI